MTRSSEELLALAGRLEKRAEKEREYVANAKLVAQLLQPEMDKFEARTGHNIYAVRLAVDHQVSAKKDAASAADLEAAVAALRSIATKDSADGQ